MPFWRSLAPHKAETPSAKRRSKRKKPARGLAARSLSLEPFEERILFAIGPQLIAVIPNEGQIISNGAIINVAPRELTFRFDDGQVIDPTTLSAIQITRAGRDHVFGPVQGVTDDVTVTTGFLGIGANPNEVVARFDNSLPDDMYQVVISGALKNNAGLPFNNGANLTTKFRLDLAPQIVSVVPQPISRNAQNQLVQNPDEIDIYFNHDTLNAGSAENPAFYELIRTSPNDTATNTDDSAPLHPMTVHYDPIKDMAVLTFASGVLTTAGSYRLRVGNSDAVPAPPRIVTVPTDPGSSFATADNLDTLGPVFPNPQGLQSLVVSSTIGSAGSTDPNNSLLFPGDPGEPGERNVGAADQSHLLDGDRVTTTLVTNPLGGFNTVSTPPAADTTDGVPIFSYNFQSIYGHISGANLSNVITDAQKQRVREVFSYISKFAGVEFVETADQGITVATGDTRAIFQGEPAQANDGINSATRYDGPGQGAVVIDNSENWGDSEPGGAYFQAAMNAIGHVLGLGSMFDLPAGALSGQTPLPAGVERVFPGDADILQLRYLYRPDSRDIDLYRFSLNADGQLNLETIAQRLTNPQGQPTASLLDSVISLYDGNGKLIARNDDYYGKDSFVGLAVKAGTYYVAVTSTGNTAFDPNVPNSGMGGTTEGAYQLRMNFTPNPSSGIIDATGNLLDGDADGHPGGQYNFWFRVDPQHTIYVDKAASNGTGPLGSILNPFTTISAALATSSTGSIVRIVGNGTADNNPDTTDTALPYNIGFDLLNHPLSDGSKMEIPKGVTVMIDAGAGAPVFRLRGANIDVGSNAQGVDRSGGALQVLGTPTQNVFFTSYNDQSVGKKLGNLTNAPSPGDWGGLVFRDDSDREAAGIFLNYVNNAQISYGGGNVTVNSVQQLYDPIHLVTSRPTISFNTITHSADAAISANPNSFEETEFQNSTFTADYGRVGPDVHGNTITGNSINGLFVRIQTLSGQNLDPLTLPARWNDTDIVYVLEENLQIQGTPGGPVQDPLLPGVRTPQIGGRLAIDPGVTVKLSGARIETQTKSQFIAEGTASNPIIFTSLNDNRYGIGGTFDTAANSTATPAAGDWGGLFLGPLSKASLDHTLVTFAGGFSTIEGGFAQFNAIEINQADARVANSTIENNDAGAPDTGGDDRNGRGTNTAAAIFVRGAQPVIVGNVIRQNSGPAISVNVNALNSNLVNDVGDTRGAINLYGNFPANEGPLVRGNRLSNNAINGMMVRGGTITTDVVWDDTDVVHVVQDEIVAPNQHSLSGTIRLQSSNTESLVVKLKGTTAGFTASGTPLDISDRIGGSVQIIGTPGHPVVLTSLSDQTVGAGLDANGKPNTNTGNIGTGLPTIADVPNGLIIDNNVATNVVGHFQVQPASGGGIPGSSSNGITAQGTSQLYINQNFIFEYTNYVDVGSDGGAISLAATTITEPATLIAPDTVESKGTFQGQNGLITWTATTTMATGQTKAQTQVAFSSPQPLGNLRFINYLDEDVPPSVSDDLLVPRGNPGDPDFLAFTLDGPQQVGFAQGGVYTTGPGQVNATWDGWAADRFAALRSAITGSGTTYSKTGNINATNLPAKTDPTLGTVYGPNDVTSAFAWSVDPTANTSLVTSYLQAIVQAPGASAGDWRSIKLDQLSNDRNVATVNELEQAFGPNGDTNNLPTNAQPLGNLAPDLKSGDDNQRLAFEVHGQISQPSDVDVYSFQGQTGTPVWMDIDRTSPSLDTILELVDANGSVVARSNDSLAESQNKMSLVGLARTMDTGSPFDNPDYYSTNPKDAGMKVVLPGVAGATNTYYVRVRSNGPDLNNLAGGQTQGVYQLQLRLRELDEFPGSTVQNADIRFATTGVDVTGLPNNSPLLGEAASANQVTTPHNSIATAQDLGNLLTSNLATLALSGSLPTSQSVDWYKFNIQYNLVNQANQFEDRTWPTTFDLDYANGMGRADTTLSIFDDTGALVLISRGSGVLTDQAQPNQGADTQNLSGGSFGPGDPFIGPVLLPTNHTYYVAVSPSSMVPSVLDQGFNKDSTNPFVRLQPIDSINRAVDDHIGTNFNTGGVTANSDSDPSLSAFQGSSVDAVNTHATPFTLNDVALFTTGGFGVGLHTVNPFKGGVVTDINDNLKRTNGDFGYGDLAMRNDGQLFSITQGKQDSDSGTFTLIDTGDGTTQFAPDDGITTFESPGKIANNGVGFGVQFDALTYDRTDPTQAARHLYAVGHRPDAAFPFNPNDQFSNIFYELDPDKGTPLSPPGPPSNFPEGPAIPRHITLDTGPGGRITGLTFIGGSMLAVTDAGGLYLISGFAGLSGANPTATFLRTVTDPDTGAPIQFSGLSFGPPDVEGGKFRNLLFASNSTGFLYCMNFSGVLQNVLNTNVSKVPINAGVTGIAFSTLDYNLWHQTDTRATDPGHQTTSQSYDHNNGNVAGGSSFYFGLEKLPTFLPGSQDYDVTRFNDKDLIKAYSTYNLPGGAYGTLTTDPFSLAGATTANQPTLYFDYFLNTQDANDQGSGAMLDSFRVFGSNDGVHWLQLTTNNSLRSVVGKTDELPRYASPQGGLYLEQEANQKVQETFDQPDKVAGIQPANSTWRQARVDLGDFAGDSNLQIRFDFSTAGSMFGATNDQDKNNKLQGDQFGNFTSPKRGQDNLHEGVYIDNVLIGFAGRGEQVLQSPAVVDKTVSNFVALPFNNDASQPRDLQTGAYQFEVRTGTLFGNTFDPFGFNVFLQNSYDVNDRMTQGFTLLAPSAAPVSQSITHTNDVFTPPHPNGAPNPNILNFNFDAPPPDATGAVLTITANADLNSSDPLANEFLLLQAGFTNSLFPVIDQTLFANAGGQDGDTLTTTIPLDRPTLDKILQSSTFFGNTNGNISKPTMQFVVTPSPDVTNLGSSKLTLTLTFTGGTVQDKQTFTVGDGLNSTIFEFDNDNTLSTPGARPVTFSSTDTPTQIATEIVAAINADPQLNVTASSPKNLKFATFTFGSFGFDPSLDPTGNRVDLFGAMNVDAGPTPDMQVLLYNSKEANNSANSQISDFVSGVKSYSSLVGDANTVRQQGLTLIQNNRITNTATTGISIGPGTTTASLTAPGGVRNLPTLNNAGLVPGIAVSNNLIIGSPVGIQFNGDAAPGAPVPFGRIVNNTIYGATTAAGVGIQVAINAGPSVLNNILSNLTTGISVDATSIANTVVGANIYQANGTNLTPGATETKGIALPLDAPLFVNAKNGDFYLKAGSQAIDSALNSLQERPSLAQVDSPLGIPPSPILAPNFDLLGQLRADDPSQPTPPGLGSNVFKDRGAIDRVDFTGPTAALVVPADNNAQDQNPSVNHVQIVNPSLSEFAIQISDGSGVGPNDAGVVQTQFTLTRNGVVLAPTSDFLFSYDATNHIAHFAAAAGIWLPGSYAISVDNSAATGINDLAGNPLLPNDATGATQFTIDLSAVAPNVWQNAANPLDVDGNGLVEPLDALIVINALNTFGSGPLPDPNAPPVILSKPGGGVYQVDTFGDGLLTPLDVLLVINHLNDPNAPIPHSAAITSAAPLTATASSPAVTPFPSNSVAFALATGPTTLPTSGLSGNAVSSSVSTLDTPAISPVKSPTIPPVTAVVGSAIMRSEWSAHEAELEDILTGIAEDVQGSVGKKDSLDFSLI